jgi:putative heme iron utilization protein
MKALTDEIVRFFQKQHFVIISTVDSNGIPHNSCKGIVKINKGGRIYLLDLYRWRTYANFKHNGRG